MLINTTARHCELGPELRQLAHQRLERLDRFARDIHEAHLIVTAEKFRHIAEVKLRLNHHELVSREESTELRLAVDRAVDAMEAQLRKFKERRVERNRRPPGGNGRDAESAPEGGEPVEEE
jgi:putative sigma-54 modulation protein